MIVNVARAQCEIQVLRSWKGLFVLSIAQLFRHGLQQLPTDDTVSLYEWAEIPEGEPVADEFGRRGDRRRARALVDQGDLAEVVALPAGSALLATRSTPSPPRTRSGRRPRLPSPP